jgi:hypothetical protein
VILECCDDCLCVGIGRRHRMVCEASLAASGCSQCEVVEWLADQLLSDVFTDTTRELQGLYDGVLESILESA